MHDLNDLAYFAAVADHGGFAAAGRALGMPKSRLSRRIALLEARLGVRLFQRTTRRFSVTETGKQFLQHCHAMLASAEAAEALIAEQSAPRGSVSLSCPPVLLYTIVADMLAEFMNDWPEIRLRVMAANRPVDVWQDGVDFALRVRTLRSPLPAEETIKPLAESPHLLLARPSLFSTHPRPVLPEDIARLPTLGMGNRPEENLWTLHDEDGSEVHVPHNPRFVVDDMSALRCGVLAGVGCAVLPLLLVHEELARGELVEVLPGWRPTAGQIQAAFASRRGMRPAVRHLLDALAGKFARLAAERNQLLPNH